MDATIEIRPENAADRKGIREVLTAAFAGSSEADLVDALRDDGALAVSLTAVGFKSARSLGVHCPFEVPDTSWMLVELERGSASRHGGTVEYHAAFSKV